MVTIVTNIVCIMNVAQRVNLINSHLKKKNLYLCVVMDVNQTYFGNHFTIYTEPELLCCTSQTNMSIISQ